MCVAIWFIVSILLWTTGKEAYNNASLLTLSMAVMADCAITLMYMAFTNAYFDAKIYYVKRLKENYKEALLEKKHNDKHQE